MNTADDKQVIAAFYAASNRGDMDSCLALLADDVTWTNVGSTKYSGRFVGKDALIANLLGPVFGQLKSGISAAVEKVVIVT